ncbi:hypothetical protein MYU51_008797 [Penicillium brevicompactum]|uniref:uncharacterized protein n=1 Tax=Penicillium brevicompactum TaxID=5074 RepID=UPI002541AD4D|nr:uncharacterized protein N7506_006713 [Penicillium brevicompactum]KAJ5332930.1 hypothetical protein N7506_006713 [Penicillium brevicompactum]
MAKLEDLTIEEARELIKKQDVDIQRLIYENHHTSGDVTRCNLRSRSYVYRREQYHLGLQKRLKENLQLLNQSIELVKATRTEIESPVINMESIRVKMDKVMALSIEQQKICEEELKVEAGLDKVEEVTRVHRWRPINVEMTL